MGCCVGFGEGRRSPGRKAFALEFVRCHGWTMDLKLAGSVHPIDCVVFDCDGVLLDTMAAKIEAFRRWVLEAHAPLQQAFMDLVMHGFGRSRRTHIEHFYRQLVGVEPDPALLDAEVARFGAICEPMCRAAPWRPGSRSLYRPAEPRGFRAMCSRAHRSSPWRRCSHRWGRRVCLM